MGMFSGLLPKIGAALNPVSLVANAFAGGLDFMSAESDRRQQAEQAGIDRNMQLHMANRNEEMQREFAQKGIRWRVEDAKAAGLHPLAALGVNPASASGSGFIPVGGASGSSAGNAYRALSNAGQNISRAVMAMQTPQERMRDQIELENAKLQGDFIRAQTAESLARARNIDGTGPGLPSPYGNSPSASVPNWPYRHTLVRNPDGTFSLQYSPEMATAMMSRPFGALMEDLEEIAGRRISPAVKELIFNLWTSKRNSKVYEGPSDFIPGHRR